MVSALSTRNERGGGRYKRRCPSVNFIVVHGLRLGTHVHTCVRVKYVCVQSLYSHREHTSTRIACGRPTAGGSQRRVAQHTTGRVCGAGGNDARLSPVEGNTIKNSAKISGPTSKKNSDIKNGAIDYNNLFRFIHNKYVFYGIW